MNDTALQFTLREMRTVFTSPRIWLVVGVIAVTLGLIGPFNTFALPVGARLAYWSATAVLTFLAGDFAITFVSAALWQRMNKWVLLPLAGIVGAVPVTLIVLAVNLIAFGPRFDAIDIGSLFVYCVAITTGVTLIFYVIEPRGPDGALLTTDDQNPSAASPPLLDRLPLHRRGRLIRLTVQDHYVEVETDRGTELVLMRLADAVKETAGVAGLQVHRSHWVALDQIADVGRTQGRVSITTTSGVTLPVSRSYLPAVRDAGLIR